MLDMDDYCFTCDNTGLVEDGCLSCGGTGNDPDYPDDACLECHGTGVVKYPCDKCVRGEEIGTIW